jgi:hypothetical protein
MNRYLSLVALMLLLTAPCLLQESCAVDVRQAEDPAPSEPAIRNDDLRESLQTCIKRLDGLEESIKTLRQEVRNPPELTTVWHFLGVYYFTGAVQGYSIPVSVVPETAREVLILFNVDTMGPGIQTIQGNAWTQRPDKKFSYFYSSHRNFASTWSTNSMYWWFPIRNTDRTLYVNSSNFVQAANSRSNNLGLGIVAYR